jgi:hypothetical protein
MAIITETSDDTRKSAKTNGITDGIISVGKNLPTKIIPSPLLLVYTDKQYLSVIRSVYTNGCIPSIYIDRITDGLYSFFGKLQRCDDVDFFQMILPTK